MIFTNIKQSCENQCLQTFWRETSITNINLIIENRVGAILILILGPDHLLWNNLPKKLKFVQRIILTSHILDEINNDDNKHDQFLVKICYYI